MLRKIFLLLIMIHYEKVIKGFLLNFSKKKIFFLNNKKNKNITRKHIFSNIYCMKKIKKNEFHDRCIIKVKGGNGGDGICSFTVFSQKKNKKYASGGRGGRGGDVYLVGNKKIDNFFNLKLRAFYYGGNGKNGRNNNQNGENGKDEYINIPLNTIIYNEEKKYINFIYMNNQKILISKGGKGGKGNYSFRTRNLKIPFVCQYGEKTKEKKIFLKKIFFCDFSIIGYPNVGKSTLLNKITSANVKIANYSYTSKFPNLGIFKCNKDKKKLEKDAFDYTEEQNINENDVDGNEINENEINENEINENEINENEINKNEINENEINENEINENETNENETNENEIQNIVKNNYTIIDFPGIIKNLNEKINNISYKYLEHLKNSKMLIYMFDINNNDIIDNYKNIKSVLVKYDENFKNKKEVVVLNKIDLYEDKENINLLINYLKENLKIDRIFCISALTGENVENTMDELILNIDDKNTLNEFLKILPKPIDIEKIENSDYYDPYDYKIYKYNENIYIIKGKYIENQANIFNFSKCDSSKIFMKILDDLNINVKLKNIGAKEGDRIIVNNYSYNFDINY
ncbi:GTP-binding protein, putative [Plasmodium relictum]|uniref:GTP-binding protein, putative n=1 Tax=Plasmodium relictum TaxID=85471 RepID=A0A1J1HID4_PLARL|nr:GTP-binding protein, putative [Plasmodium relictum]CRH04021.1 GTP-binding protein, putative [Plasmodium relictum]